MAARILIIEDNPADRELMIRLLTESRYAPSVAHSGEAGLEAMQRELPALVLCDIHLPRMDGFEVVRRVKSEERTSSVPIVAVTPVWTASDGAKAAAAGFAGLIAKPISPDTFVLEVRKFL